jgi:hypothetical protein
VSEEELTFKKLLKKHTEAAEQCGITIAAEEFNKGVKCKDVKKYEAKLIEKYETLKTERDEWKEKYCKCIDEKVNNKTIWK